MGEIVIHIKNIILSFNGVLLVKERELPSEVQDLQEEIYSEEGVGNIQTDKENMRKDYLKLKGDLAIAVEKYKEENP